MEAWDQDGTRARDTFFVSVGGCPPDVSPGIAQYFPVELGRQWTFTYASGHSGQRGPEQWTTRVEGSLRWSFTDFICRRDEIGIRIVEELSATSRGARTYPERKEEAPIAVERRDTLNAIYAGSRLSIPKYTHYMPSPEWQHCGQIGGELELQWQYPSVSP